MDESFPKSRRLLKRSEFDRTFDQGVVLKNDQVVIYCAEGTTEQTRLGIVIGSHVKKAVQRNRLKRVIRAGFRRAYSGLPKGYDLVVIPRNTSGLSSADVRKSLRSLVTEDRIAQKQSETASE
jgi:ribonuclease P protein component